jgi:hypothetical protein
MQLQFLYTPISKLKSTALFCWATEIQESVLIKTNDTCRCAFTASYVMINQFLCSQTCQHYKFCILFSTKTQKQETSETLTLNCFKTVSLQLLYSCRTFLIPREMYPSTVQLQYSITNSKQSIQLWTYIHNLLQIQNINSQLFHYL